MDLILRILILCIIILEFFIYFQVFDISLLSSKFFIPENHSDPSPDLNRLNVKELKRLAVELRNGRPLQNNFVEKRDLIDYVKNLQKSQENLCGKIDLETSSELYQFERLIEEFVESENKLWLIWYANKGAVLSNINSKLYRVELTKKLCGQFAYALIQCTSNENVKQVCRKLGFTKYTGLVMTARLRGIFNVMDSYTEKSNVSEIRAWIQTLMTQLSPELIKCPLVVKSINNKFHSCQHSVQCPNNNGSFYVTLFNSTTKYHVSDGVAYEKLLQLVCPEFLDLYAIYQTFSFFGVVLFSTFFGMKMSFEMQLKNSFFLIALAVFWTAVQFAIFKTPIEWLFTKRLCKWTIWKKLIEFFFLLDGHKNVTNLLEFKFRIITFTLFASFVIVQNRLVSRIFGLKGKDRSLIQLVSMLWRAIFGSNNRQNFPIREQIRVQQEVERVDRREPVEESEERDNVDELLDRLMPEMPTGIDFRQMSHFRRLVREYFIWQLMQQIADPNNQALRVAKEALDATIQNQSIVTCTICQAEIEMEQKIYKIRCKHPFHADCLHTWVFNHDQFTCPNCRQNIERFT